MHGHTDKPAGMQQIFEAWRRRRWLGATVFLAALVPALSLVAALPNIYKASTTVLVERPQVSETFVHPTVTDEVETRIQTLSEEILSRENLSSLVARFDLYPQMRRTASGEDAVLRLRHDIGLDLKGVERTWDRSGTVAFALSYHGRDPRQVADVANALASLYVEQNTKSREKQAVQTTEFLKTQMQSVKQRLTDQEALIGSYKKRHAGELPQQVESNLSSLDRLNAALQLNNEKQVRALERLDDRAAAGATGGDGAAPAGGAALRERLQRQLADLRRQYSDRYPDVVRLERQLAALDAGEAGQAPDGGSAAAPAPAGAAPSTPAGGATAAPGGEMQALKQEEERLRRSIAEYERRVDQAPERQQEYQQLSRDYDTTREMYDSLLKRYEESLLAENMERGRTAEQFRVLEPAVAPRDPAAPNRLWLALMILIVSTGLSAGAVALAEQLDTTFHSVDGLRAFTRVPVLATIPRIVSRRDMLARGLKMAGAALIVVLGLASAAGATHYVARACEPLVYLLSGGRL